MSATALYASVLLNRLMVIYFCRRNFSRQRKCNYLQEKLADTPEARSTGTTNFLKMLFFEGFAKRNTSAVEKRSSCSAKSSI